MSSARSMASLPPEILIEIINIMLETAKDEFCRIGEDAVRRSPKLNALESALLQTSRPTTSLNDTNGLVGDNEDENRSFSGVGSEDDPKAKQIPGFYSVAKALRLVNCTFNHIVTPIMYESISLLLDSVETYSPQLDISFRKLILPNAHHIRTLCIYGNPEYPTDEFGNPEYPKDGEDLLDEYTAGVIKMCPQLTSLGLYLRYSYGDWGMWAKVREAVLFSLEHGSLTSLGIYSRSLLSGWGDFCAFDTVSELIPLLAQSDKACSRLKRLDMAVRNISRAIYDLIRSRFTALEYLSFAQVFELRDRSTWSDEPERWKSYLNLTKLQFFHSIVHFANVPSVVQSLPSLRELLISGSTSEAEQPFGFHEQNWHLSQTAIHHSRRPLDWLHLADVESWQIRALAPIPTSTLVITDIQPFQLLNEMRRDLHIFPGMKLLKVSRSCHGREDDKGSEIHQIRKICRKRKVQAMRNAEGLYQSGWDY
ncbi:hypothetical protein CPB86DRAFT_875139 [Serendipita vermifera]|nr:hypothetical protein CPB86DRAFT_875139 [Serendipita vermifera]